MNQPKLNLAFRIYNRLRQEVKCIRINQCPFFKQFPTKIHPIKINQRVAIELTFKFVYFRIPKAANSTVISTLHKSITGKEFSGRDEMEKWKTEGFNHPLELSKRISDETISSFFKFTFVRDPYSRWLSVYRDKICRLENIKFTKKLRRKLGIGASEAISMDQFLCYLESFGGIYDDPHWARQVDLVVLPANKLDFIGRVESIEKDLNFVQRQIFGKETELISYTRHATNAKSGLDELEDNIRKRIYRIYETDFDQFSYTPI